MSRTPRAPVDPWQRFLGPLLASDTGTDAEWMSQVSLMAMAQASRWRQLAPVRTTLEALSLIHI